MKAFLPLTILCSASCSLRPEGERVLAGEKIRVLVSARRELVQIRDGATWVDALDSRGSALRVADAGCAVESTDRADSRIVVKVKCPAGTFVRELELGSDPDVISVKVRFTGLNPDTTYALVVNGRNIGSSPERELLDHGYSLRL